MAENEYFDEELKDLARQKRRVHNDIQAEVNDLRAIMSTKPGRRTMWRLLEKAGVYRLSFSPHDGFTEFNEGKRSLGLEYLALLDEHCLAELQLMQKERQQMAKRKQKED
jgi:hypothetical protein